MASMFRPTVFTPLLSVARTDALRAFSGSTALLAVRRQNRDLAEPPKGSPTSYALYVKDWFNREKGNLQAEGGKIKISEVSHDISSSWKTLPESDKAKYDATAKKLRTEYESEFKNYLSGLTPAKKAAVEAQMGKSMKVPMASKGRKGSDGVTRKKPVTAFFEFLAHMRETGGIDVSGEAGRNRVTMFSKRAGDQWKSMSEAEKQPYKDTAASKMATYLAQLK